MNRDNAVLRISAAAPYINPRGAHDTASSRTTLPRQHVFRTVREHALWYNPYARNALVFISVQCRRVHYNTVRYGVGPFQ